MSGQVSMSPEYVWTTKWWAFGGRFPLLPVFRFRAGNQYNTDGFHFQWLSFRVWSMDSVQLSFDIGIDDQICWVKFFVPYLIFGIFQPIFPHRFSQKLWRKPKRDPIFTATQDGIYCVNGKPKFYKSGDKIL